MNLYYSEETENFTSEISDMRDEDAIASAFYNKTYEIIGWDYLSISSYEKNDTKYNDSLKAYAMGYLEGILTKDRIYSQYENFYKYFMSIYPDNAIQAFFGIIQKNGDYMRDKALKNMDNDPYWEHIYYIYRQLYGLYKGYSSVAEKDKKLEFVHFLVLSGLSDDKDIVEYLFRSMRANFDEMTQEERDEYLILNTHCSAFVRLNNDSSDIFFGHNTWNYYTLMIRIFKEYRFVTNRKNEKCKTMVFSSYPAALSSIDEFYYMDSNLLMMGTSNNIYNNSLYDLLTYESIFIWVRQIVANRLASSGEEWTKFFAIENSGTNTEQAIILDINKISLEKKEIKDKALMIIEQMPKYSESKDVTDYLRNGYWPSYNVPFIDKIYKDLNYEVVDGENIQYTQSPRAKIFKRDANKVNTI